MTEHHRQAASIRINIHVDHNSLEFEGDAMVADVLPLIEAFLGGMTTAEVTEVNADLEGLATRLETLAQPDPPAATDTR